jgi:hypothetical protein
MEKLQVIFSSSVFENLDLERKRRKDKRKTKFPKPNK